MTSIAIAREVLDFAEKALADFREHPEHTTFGTMERDSLFAVRWGLDGVSVRVFRISVDTPVQTFWK